MTLQYFIDRKIKGTLSRWFGIRFQHPSETAKVRHWVLPYCTGKGCDIGFGGDKVKKIDCDGIDFPQPYAFAGKDKVDIACYNFVETRALKEHFQFSTIIIWDHVSY